jgi:hypothetical protein
VKVKEEWFRQLRFDKHNHLGLGDIRLTIGQQEEILAAMKEKESLAHDRGVIIDSQLEQIAALQAEIAFLHRTITETQDIGLLARIKELTEALEKYGGHSPADGSPICEHSKHSDYPCTCGFEAVLTAQKEGGMNFIGWKAVKGMSMQHFARFCDDGGVTIHCKQTTKDESTVSGFSFNNFQASFLLDNPLLPKCKKCQKEMDRIERLTAQKEGRDE